MEDNETVKLGRQWWKKKQGWWSEQRQGEMMFLSQLMLQIILVGINLAKKKGLPLALVNHCSGSVC